MRIAKSNFMLPAVSAVILALSFPSHDIEPLAWCAFIPLFISLENKTAKRRFLSGYVFGVVFFALVLHWLMYVSVLGTVAISLYLGLYPAVFCLYRPGDDTHDILAVSSLWVLTEFVRAHMFTGFPWALLGHTQYLNLPVIQIADTAGAYGVSFVVMSVNFAAYSVISRKKTRFMHVIVCLMLMIVTLYYGFSRLRQNVSTAAPLRVSLVQGNVPQDIKWDTSYRDMILDKYEELTLAACGQDPDIVIWPETAVPGLLESEDMLGERIAGLAG
ncbi:MAG: apolipoprotein N-acyltransferase, partial [Candidatus Omnitrophota bacterium]